MDSLGILDERIELRESTGPTWGKKFYNSSSKRICSTTGNWKRRFFEMPRRRKETDSGEDANIK